MWLTVTLATNAANVPTLVDVNCKFLWTDVGCFGAMSDSQSISESELKQCYIVALLKQSLRDHMGIDETVKHFFDDRLETKAIAERSLKDR